MTTKFDEAVLAVVDGDLTKLTALLAAAPGLVTAQSKAPFEAPLLHYCAANGVENELQRTPANAPAIAQALLDAGAKADALGQSYNGGPNATAMCLLVSSYHPFARGVQSDLVRTLVGGGAALNGLEDDGAPLNTALLFGYTDAASTLVECGARVDNVLFAAGVGDLESVRGWFDDQGKLREGALGTYKPIYPDAATQDPATIVQLAFHFSVSHGQVDVARELLAKGASARGESLGQHARLPLLQCLFVYKDGMIPLLLEHGADPHEVDAKLGVHAIDYAERTKRAGIAERLRSHRS